MYRFPFAIIMSVLFVTPTLLSAEPEKEASMIVPVWPDAPPNWVAPEEAERDTSGPDSRTVSGKAVVRLGYVSTPQLHVYPAKDSDTTVIISPGGGYSILAWDLEGTEIARWMQGLGVNAVVLKYRVPTRNQDVNWLAPVQDIQRAIALVRGGKVAGVGTKQVGVLGFSAGGNASARAALATERHYEAIDSVDSSEIAPDFAILVYPAWLVQEDQPTELLDELSVSADSPPMFLAHAEDDRVSCLSSVSLFAALKQQGVEGCSLHVFSSGGHGYGARETGHPTDQWPSLCRTWLINRGLAKP